jgi:hypothetical protein
MTGLTVDGYVRAYKDGRRVREHVYVAEKALGKPLPRRAVVHHVNEARTDNRPGNLVICPDQGYHNVIHGRMKALAATGNANSKPCRYCHKYELPGMLFAQGTSHYHKRCNAKYHREYRLRRE